MKRLLIITALMPFAATAQSKKAVAQKPAAKAVASANSLQAAVNRGKLVYATNCLPCHQADGSGVPRLNPPLINTSWVLGSKTVLIQQILKGSQGKVEIDGETFNNAMPAQAHLTDQQIADVITFVRNSFGNKATMVTPAEVKLVRAKTK